MTLRQTLLAALAVVGLPTIAAVAAGSYQGFPIVGQSSYCASYSTGATGQICPSTIPAGPTNVDSNYLFPADTGITAGGQPQTVTVPSSQIASFSYNRANPRNFLRNGDISVNPFQRGTGNSATASPIAGTTTYGPDGWAFKGGSSSNIVWSKQTGATDILAGFFTASVRMQRAATNTDTAPICMLQPITTERSMALQGRSFVLSFYALAGANQSSTLNNITMSVISGTGTDQSGTNMINGAWTSQATPVTSTQAISTTWTQYTAAGSIGATATQVGVSICYTPVGTAGTNDWIEVSNIQLEEVKASTVTNPSAFEHHPAFWDLEEAQRFFFQVNESGAGGLPVAICEAGNGSANGTTGLTVCNVGLPAPFRVAPTAFSTFVVGSFQLLDSGSASLITSPVATLSSTNILQFTTTNVLAPGRISLLRGGSVGTGIVSISSEL